jgi:ubiquinone/menaquinone biosynthesis C-methylase UbiE
VPNYDSWSNYLENDTLLVNAIRLQALIRLICKLVKPGCKLLEAGFGSGNTGMLLSNMGYDVTLLDIEKSLIDSFQDRFPGHVSNGRIKVVLGDMYRLPFVDNSLDLVYHQGVLEHLDDAGIVSALQEQARVGRMVVIDVPNNKYPDHPYGNERWISNRRWLQLIRDAGLEVIELSGRRFPRWTYLFPHMIFLPPLYERLKLGARLGVVSIFVCQAKSQRSSKNAVSA